jgi:hypothetical protein
LSDYIERDLLLPFCYCFVLCFTFVLRPLVFLKIDNCDLLSTVMIVSCVGRKMSSLIYIFSFSKDCLKFSDCVPFRVLSVKTISFLFLFVFSLNFIITISIVASRPWFVSVISPVWCLTGLLAGVSLLLDVHYYSPPLLILISHVFYHSYKIKNKNNPRWQLWQFNYLFIFHKAVTSCIVLQLRPK